MRTPKSAISSIDPITCTCTQRKYVNRGGTLHKKTHTYEGPQAVGRRGDVRTGEGVSMKSERGVLVFAVDDIGLIQCVLLRECVNMLLGAHCCGKQTTCPANSEIGCNRWYVPNEYWVRAPCSAARVYIRRFRVLVITESACYNAIDRADSHRAPAPIMMNSQADIGGKTCCGCAAGWRPGVRAGA